MQALIFPKARVESAAIILFSPDSLTSEEEEEAGAMMQSSRKFLWLWLVIGGHLTQGAIGYNGARDYRRGTLIGLFM